MTRPDILPASALRTTAGQFATTVTARVTLPGSVLRVTVPVTAVAAVALTAIVEVSNIQEVYLRVSPDIRPFLGIRYPAGFICRISDWMDKWISR